MCKYLKLFFAFSFFISGSHCVADDINNSIPPSYNWGRGLNISSANLILGGYVNLIFNHFESKQDVAALNDLSLFISWSPHARIRFFSELEMENLVTNHGVAGFDKSFSFERLYVDFLVTDSFSVRLGQFLTPVGLWNTIHAAPLVWTTSRPITTKNEIFPSQTNGLMLSKQFVINEHDLDFSLYFDNSDNLNPRSLNGNKHVNAKADFKYAIGSYIKYKVADPLSAGISYLAFKKRADTNLSTNHLLGLDLFWEKHGYEMQLELSYRTASDEQKNEINGYLQSVIPLGNKLFAIGRYEFIDGTHQLINSTTVKGTTHIGLSALAWRPFIPFVVKAEYRFGDNNQQIAPSGFFTSVSMLF